MTAGRVKARSLAVGTGGVHVASGAPVDMGGNRVRNIGAPVEATDAANKAYVDNAFAGMGEGLNDAFRRIDEANEGVALAIAMGGLVMPAGKDFAIGANWGFYEDRQAIAAQAALRLDDTLTLNAGVGLGLDSNTVGGRVGFVAAW